MLRFIFGRSGYGKTEYVFNRIKQCVDNNEDNILLITPEQYSLVAERRLLKDLGEANVNKVENGSFSRISNAVHRLYGGDTLPVLTKGGKVILMSQAINSCKNELTLFNKKLDTLSFVNSIIDIYDEMKSCCLSGSEIASMASGIDNEILFRKLNDISLIMNAYEEIIKDNFLDPSDEIKRLYDKICSIGYFKGKKVFIDGFNGFVAQEYKLLELIISEADEVVITLCTDSFDLDDRYNLFAYVNNTARILSRIAEKAGVPIEKNTLCRNLRTDSNVLKAIEQCLFADKELNIDENNYDDSCVLYKAKNITDECNNTARNIKKLIRNGYNPSDITVIVRDLNIYKDELAYSFRKYEIPFFNDERQPIATQPLVLLIKYLLRSVNYSLKSDDILSAAKTGLTPLADAEINNLENYIYLWNINGLKWTKPFVNSTKGFTGEKDFEDENLLNEINISREKIISPILYLKNKSKSKSSQEICEAIYNTLIYLGADSRLKEYAVKLNNMGFTVLAREQERVWDLVMEILNQMAITINDSISLKDFEKLFDLIVASEDLGVIPSGIENITIGQADRIRTDNPKVVFVLGANEGVFPRDASRGGLLSESERQIMLKNDFKLYSYGEIINLQERYFAYMACSAPREKLFVSFIGKSEESSHSEIITDIINTLNGIKIKTISDVKDIDLIESRQNAFELMSENFYSDSTFFASLKDYFKDDPRFTVLKSLVDNEDLIVNNKQLSTKLFDKSMYISASRIEDYYSCPFRYFCKFGLNARPRSKAEIDPMQRGTLIHYVLEMILSDVGSKNLSKLTNDEIIKLVDKYLEQYFKTELGSIEDITSKLKYNFKRLSHLIYSVVFHLAKEFSNCDFEAKAFELSIDKDGEVKPEVLSLENGGTIQIRGSIDRVDTYEKNGTRYVRVVDYKSGNKSFNLSDIMAGLNLQMFVYLFSLCEDKGAELNGVPAGVLYMHAARDIFNFDSNKIAKDSVDSEEGKSFKMKGIVLADEDNSVAEAMENDLKGNFIPVKLKSNGDITGQLITLEELGIIHKKINSLIQQMGNSLHNGIISQAPVKNKTHKNTCEYCDYGDVCNAKRLISFRETPDLTDNEVKQELRKEFENHA